jgi:hypothetical protein
VAMKLGTRLKKGGAAPARKPAPKAAAPAERGAYSLRAAAKYLGMGVGALSALAHAGAVKAYWAGPPRQGRPGSKMQFLKRDLEAYVRGLRPVAG